jgi:hypothetical protein
MLVSFPQHLIDTLDFPNILTSLDHQHLEVGLGEIITREVTPDYPSKQLI